MTPEDIKNLARLARIEVTDSEIASFQTEMQSILGYVDQVNQVELAEVSPEYLQKNVARTDTVSEFEGVSMVDQAPESQDGFYKVPKIL